MTAQVAPPCQGSLHAIPLTRMRRLTPIADVLEQTPEYEIRVEGRLGDGARPPAVVGVVGKDRGRSGDRLVERTKRDEPLARAVASRRNPCPAPATGLPAAR